MDQPEVYQHLTVRPHGRVEMLEHTLHQGVPIRAAAGGVVALVPIGRAGEQQRGAVVAHHVRHQGGVGAVAAEQAMVAQQPEVAGTGDGLARRLRIGIGGILRRLLRIRRASRAVPLGGIRGQSLGRVAVGHGISSRREDVCELIRREAERAQVDVRHRLHRGQRVTQQRLVPGRVLRDAIVGEAQRLLLRRGQVAQHDHRHLGHAERHRSLEPTVPRDQHAILIHQQRVGEPEGQHAGLDLLELLGAVDARVAGMRAQLRHRTQQDLRRHPGERHDAIRFAGGLQGSGPASVCS